MATVLDIGVDLGTASVVIYGKGKDVVLNEPAVIAFDRDSRNVLAVGEWGIDRSIVLCPHNVEHAEKSLYLPWYMVMFLHPGI